MTVGPRHHGIESANESKFADIYRRYGRMVHAYCARRVPPSQAADAVAEVFLVAWRRIEQVPGDEATLPWLYGVAFRVVSHQWRSKARSRKLSARLRGLAQAEPPTPDLVLLRREEDRIVIEAASHLKPVEQEILRLTLWEELSHAEVATVLGLDPGAAKQRAYRARRKLAAEYQKLDKGQQPPAALKGGTR